MEKSHFEIRSLDELIDVIEQIQRASNSKNTMSTLYFRGQNKRYIDPETDTDMIIAAGHQQDFTAPSDKRYHSEDKVNAFYRRVAHQLTPLEADNFLAYAHHHGLQTPLIEITSDAIVALYFAVQNAIQDEDNDDDAVIYVFDEKNMVDVTEDIAINKTFNIYDLLLSPDPIAIDKLLNFFLILEANHPLFTDLFTGLIETIVEGDYDDDALLFREITEISNNLPADTDEHSIKQLINALKDNPDINQLFHEFYEPYAEYLGITSIRRFTGYLRNIENDIGLILYPWYVFILKSYFEYQHKAFAYPTEEALRIPRLPNFLYRPAVIYDELLAQSISYIVQGKVSAYPKDTIEEIVPDYIITVKNKKQIYNALKLLGINKTKYFNDPESIADYVNKNYY